LVMTSAYERPTDRAKVRPYRLGGRKRGVSRYSPRSPIRETKQNVKENGREQGLTDKDVARKFAKEQATARKKAR